MNLSDAVNVVNDMELEDLPDNERDAILLLMRVCIGVSAFTKVLLPTAEELEYVYDHVEAHS